MPGALQALALLVLGLLAAQGARAQKITMEFDQTTRFQQIQNICDSRRPVEQPKSRVEQRTGEETDRSGHPKRFHRQGLDHGDQRVPDLNVRYTFGAARKTEIEAYPAGWYGMGTRYVRVPYAEGTLVIDMRDPTTRSLVWRSIAAEDKSDPSKIQGKINDMVKKSIDKYPPKKK